MVMGAREEKGLRMRRGRCPFGRYGAGPEERSQEEEGGGGEGDVGALVFLAVAHVRGVDFAPVRDALAEVSAADGVDGAGGFELDDVDEAVVELREGSLDARGDGLVGAAGGEGLPDMPGAGGEGGDGKEPKGDPAYGTPFQEEIAEAAEPEEAEEEGKPCGS